jgi:hypothetical protein
VAGEDCVQQRLQGPVSRVFAGVRPEGAGGHDAAAGGGRGKEVWGVDARIADQPAVCDGFTLVAAARLF